MIPALTIFPQTPTLVATGLYRANSWLPCVCRAILINLCVSTFVPTAMHLSVSCLGVLQLTLSGRIFTLGVFTLSGRIDKVVASHAGGCRVDCRLAAHIYTLHEAL